MADNMAVYYRLTAIDLLMTGCWLQALAGTPEEEITNDGWQMADDMAVHYRLTAIDLLLAGCWLQALARTPEEEMSNEGWQMTWMFNTG
jgi:hypothetical protein